MQKQLLIYDLDGTLVDTREDIARAANHMLREMNEPLLTTAEVARHVGKGLHSLMRSLLRSDDAKRIEKAAKIYREFYGAHMMDSSRLYPGALEMLEKYRGRKQAVITNKPNPFTEDILRALGVADFFVEIVAGDAGYPRKPDPAAVKTILAREKIAPEAALFVGDSLVDIETARNAGIAIAVFTHGFQAEADLRAAGPEVIAPDFPALVREIEKRGW